MLKKLKKSLVSIGTAAMLIGAISGVAGAESSPPPTNATATLDYNCSIPNPILPFLTIDFEMPLTINALVPTSVSPNALFDVENAYATASVPGSVIGTLHSLLGWSSVEGKVTKFEVKSENTNKTIDVASSGPIEILPAPVPTDGSPFVFTVPDVYNGQSALTVGKFEAGNSGVVTIKGGNINATFQKEGGSLIKLNASCTPPSNSTLVDINIE